jgi:hypothetical protein
LSQNELIAVVEDLTGSKFPVTHQKSVDLRKAGEEKLEQGDFRAFIDLLRVHNGADNAGNELKEQKSANGLIGLPYEDIRAAVESSLKKQGAL